MSHAFDTTDPDIMDDSAVNARQSDDSIWYSVNSSNFTHPYIYTNEIEPPDLSAANSSSSSHLSYNNLLPTSSDNRRYQQNFNGSRTQYFQRPLGPTRSRLFQALTGTNSPSYTNHFFSNTQDVSIDTLRSREDEESELALLSYHQFTLPSNTHPSMDNTRLPPVNVQFGASNNLQQIQNRPPSSNETQLNSQYQYQVLRPPYSNRPSSVSNSSTSNTLLGQIRTNFNNHEPGNNTIPNSRSVSHRNSLPHLSYDAFYGYPSSFLSDLPNNNILDDYNYQLRRLEQASQPSREPSVPSQTVSNLRETSGSNSNTYAPRINVNSGSVVLPPIFMPHDSLPSYMSKQEFYMTKSSKQQLTNKSMSWIRNGVKYEGETYSLRNLFRRDPGMLSSCPHCKIELKICNIDMENNRASVILKDCSSDPGPRSTQLWEGVIIEGPTCTINDKSPTTEIYNVTKHWQQLHPTHSLSNNHDHIINSDIYRMRKAHLHSLSTHSNSYHQLPPISYCEPGNDVQRADRMLAKAKDEYVWLLLTKVDTGRLFSNSHRPNDHSSRWQSSNIWARKKVQLLVSIRRSDGLMEGCMGKNRVDMKLLYAQPDRFAQLGMVADIRQR